MFCSCEKIENCTTATEVCDVCERCIMQREATGKNNQENTIHEHAEMLLTEQRIKDINSALAIILIKCGLGSLLGEE